MTSYCRRRLPRIDLHLFLLFLPIAAGRASDFSRMDLLKATPIEVTAGPLLFLIKPEGEPRRESIYVVGPESGRAPQRFLITPGNIVFPERVDRTRVIAYSKPSSQKAPEGYLLLDLAAGAARPLLPDACFDTDLVALDGARAFFLENQEKRSLSGADLQAGIVLDDSQRTDRLWMVDLDDPGLAPQPVFDRRIAELVRVAGERFWVITPGDEPELWSLSRNGKDHVRALERFGRILAIGPATLFAATRGDAPELWRFPLEGSAGKKLLQLDASCEPDLLSGACSPGEKYIALGLARRGREPGRRELAVFDAERGTEVSRVAGIFVGPAPGKPSFLPLEPWWGDEGTVWFTETAFSPERYRKLMEAPAESRPPISAIDAPEDGYVVAVAIDARTGKRLRETVWGPIVSQNRLPPRLLLSLSPVAPLDAGPDPSQTWFRVESSKIWFQGDAEPAIDIRIGTESMGLIAVSADGEWAAAAVEMEDHQRQRPEVLWLLDGKKRSKKAILHGWVYHLTWLPRAGEGSPTGD